MKPLHFLQWIILTLPMIFSGCSCSLEAGIRQVLGTSVEAPVFLECRPVSSTEIVFSFSVPVSVVSLNFDPAVEAVPVEEGCEIRVRFSGTLEEGSRVTADIVVEDDNRNSLNVIVPFRSRNDRMPGLLFNELRTDYSKPRLEFIEFLTEEAGNLGGLRLFIAGDSLSVPVYEFSPVEVNANEYIVLHLRKVGEECVDETGANLALSGGNDAQNSARDLWLSGSGKVLHRTDALWLLDQDDKIIDAVLLSEKNGAEWDTKEAAIASAADYLGRSGAWLGAAPRDSETGGSFIPSPVMAASSAGTSPTRTICRDQNIPAESRAVNWYIAAQGCDTAGRPNNPRRHTR